MNNYLIQAQNAEWPAGFVMKPRVQTLSAELLEAYQSVPTAHISDSLGRFHGSNGLHDYHGAIQRGGLCGNAVTVKTRPGDNLMIHAAILSAQPGDIIVVDASADLSTAVIGGLMRTTAIAKKIGGFVIDGAIRDIEEWAQGDMPIYAKGHTHKGPKKEGPGELNTPIACAGMVVNPGDLIVADADGVVCVPASDAQALLTRCQELGRHEEKVRAQNMAGTPDVDRFLTLLRKKNCPL